MKLVVAEDDPVMIGLLKMVFKLESDIQTTVVDDNWCQLLVDFDWSDKDVVLVDQMLGNYRGSDMLKWLEKNAPHVRRVMFTGDSSMTVESAHAHQVVVKPASPKEVVAAVRGTLPRMDK